MHSRLRIIAGMVAVCMAAASRPPAQIPRAWAEVATGFGQGVSSQYQSDLAVTEQVRVAVGTRLTTRYGLELDGWHMWPLNHSTMTVLCAPTGCNLPEPFSMQGVSASVVRQWHLPGQHAGEEFGLGAGSYVASNAKQLGTPQRVFAIQLTGAILWSWSHVAGTLSARPMFLPNLHGRTGWFLPAGIGIRAF